MNESAKLSITKRERSSKGVMNQLRQDGFLPGSIDVKGQDAVSFSIRRDEFRKARRQRHFQRVCWSWFYHYPAMIREIQYAPVARTGCMSQQFVSTRDHRRDSL